MILYWEVFIVVIVETVRRFVNSCKVLFCSTNHWRFATDNELGKPKEVIRMGFGKNTFHYTPFSQPILVVL